MKIIVVGGGKVGFTICEQLSREGHDITIIDLDGQKLKSIVNALDVMGVSGNGTSYRIQQEAGVEDADILIAVTDKDEINMLSCLIAKKAGDCKTVARVRNPGYFEEIEFIKNELGLSMFLNPEMESARDIAKLIQIPSALDVDSFAGGRVNLVKVKIPRMSCLNGLALKNLSAHIGGSLLVCIIERGKEVIIPNGNTIMYEDDIIYIITPLWETRKVLKKAGINTKPIKDVTIAGGGRISYYLTRLLVKSGVNVKIIEKDREACDLLSEMLPEAMIIYGDASNKQLLMEENVDNTDAFVTVTNIDEENIVLSLYVNKISQAKIITKINKITFEEVIKEMPIGSVICPKNITAERIVSYVRALQNSWGSNIETLYRMLDDRIEALEFVVRENDSIKNMLNVPLKDLNLIDNLIICCINRGGSIITPTGKDCLKNGDTVVVVTSNLGLDDLSNIFKN